MLLGHRAVDRELTGERRACVRAAPRGHAEQRQAGVGGFGAGPQPPGDQELLGPLHPERAHEPLAAAGAVDLTGAEMAVTDAGVVGDRDEVARQRQLEPAGHARAVDHRDAHEPPVLQARVQRPELVEERAELAFVVVHVHVRAEVTAGGERRARAGDDHRPHHRVGVGFLRERTQAGHGGVVERVALVGAGEGEDPRRCRGSGRRPRHSRLPSRRASQDQLAELVLADLARRGGRQLGHDPHLLRQLVRREIADRRKSTIASRSGSRRVVRRPGTRR